MSQFEHLQLQVGWRVWRCETWRSTRDMEHVSMHAVMYINGETGFLVKKMQGIECPTGP